MTTAFQSDSFQNDAFQIDAAVVVSATGGLPLSYKEWARRTRKDEEEDAPPKPKVVELIGQVEKTVETKPFIPLPPIETGLSELTRSQIRRMKREARRRRLDDEWLLIH